MVQQSTLEQDNLMKKFSLGIYKDEKNRTYLPEGWQCLAKSEEKNGFYAEAFVKNGKIIIVYRGTDGSKDLLGSDKDMYFKNFPKQADSALNFYYQVESVCKKYGYNKDDITITGHSLGGSLTQYVCYITGREGVTFNPYGVKESVEKFGVIKNKQANVRNYGNVNDKTFYTNLHNMVGKTFVIDTNKNETEPRILKYHKIENMGDIRDADPYDRAIHHKFEKESMHPDRVLVVEDVINREKNKHSDVFSQYFLEQARKGYTMWRKDVSKSVSSGDVYVHSYTRSDGTPVTDYYRSRPNR